MRYWLTLILLLVCTTASADIDLDRWADAIFKAEGGYNAQYLYGIRSVSYKDEKEAREICKRTVYNTLVKYRSTRCKPGDSDLECMARRYCPVGAKNDPRGLNRHWIKNVGWFLSESSPSS